MIDGVPAADRYLFDLEGYLVIEDALDAAQVAAVNAEVDRLLEDADPDAPTVSFGAGGGELRRRARHLPRPRRQPARRALPGGAGRPRRAARPRVRARAAPRHRRHRPVVRGAARRRHAVRRLAVVPLPGRAHLERADRRRLPPARRRPGRRRARDRPGQPQGQPAVPRRVARPRRGPPPERPPRRRAGRHRGRSSRRRPRTGRCRGTAPTSGARCSTSTARTRSRGPGATTTSTRSSRSRSASGGCWRRRTAARRAASSVAPDALRASPRGWRGSSPGCPPRRAACPRGSP